MTGTSAKAKLSEQELWVARLDRVCHREPAEDEWTHTLINQGICHDRCIVSLLNRFLVRDSYVFLHLSPVSLIFVKVFL